MRIIIGVTPDNAGEDALTLGAALCRLTGAGPLLTHAHPTPYSFLSKPRVDTEWVDQMASAGAEVLQEATETMVELGFTDVETKLLGNRSSGEGLREAVEDDVQQIVIGSAPGASTGRIQIGSTAHQLLHGSPVPVAIAPSGHRRSGSDTIGGLVLSYRPGRETDGALEQLLPWARSRALPITLLGVLLRNRMYSSALMPSGEDKLMQQLTKDMSDHMAATVKALPDDVEIRQEILIGDTVHGALQRRDWRRDEILALSSAPGGPLKRIFMGDTTHRLIRATSVPVMVLTRRR